MSYKFQEKEQCILSACVGRGKIPILCPFCRTKADLYCSDLSSSIEAVGLTINEYNFMFLCTNCKVHGTFNIESKNY